MRAPRKSRSNRNASPPRRSSRSAGRACHERACADRRRAGAVARHDHGRGVEDRRARDRRAGAGQRVTLEQIQGLSAEPLSAIFYNMPGVSLQDRGDEPSTVDQHPRPAGFRPRRGRRRRRAAELSAHRPQRERLVLPRSRTGRRHRCRARPDRQHLRLRRDRRRGLVPHQGHQGRRASRRALGCRSDRHPAAPTSAAGSARSSAACASIPNVDVFGGAVYRTQDNYKDGNGTEIGNTGNRARRRTDEADGAAGGRPRGQARRHIPGIPVSIGQRQSRARPRRRRRMAAIQGTSVYASDAKNYTGDAHLEILPAGRQYGSTGTRRSTAIAPKTTRSRPTTTSIDHRGGSCGGVPGNNISGCVGDSRGYVLDTLGIDVNNTTRFNVGDWRNAVTYWRGCVPGRRDDDRHARQLQHHHARRRAHGFRRLRPVEAELFDLARSCQRDPLRPLRAEFADSRSAGGDRFSPKITIGVTPVAGLHALCQLCRRLSRARRSRKR